VEKITKGFNPLNPAAILTQAWSGWLLVSPTLKSTECFSLLPLTYSLSLNSHSLRDSLLTDRLPTIYRLVRSPVDFYAERQFML